jgi:hypothetical protein
MRKCFVTRRALLPIAAIALMTAPAMAGGEARIAQGLRYTSGVEAEASANYVPPRRSRSKAPAAQVHGVRYSRGVVLVPLVAQVSCGHDPTVPGGLTCMLPPPPKPTIADAPRRRRAPTPDEVARGLTDRAIRLAPRPRFRLAPARRGLTGLPSFFWLAQRPRPITAQAGAGPVTVTAQARPVQFVWHYGDGTDRATRGSGRRWTKRRPGTIKHVYEGKGRYTLEVEVIWHARWRIGAGAWQSLGYFSNSATRGYRVRSLVPVLVKPHGTA